MGNNNCELKALKLLTMIAKMNSELPFYCIPVPFVLSQFVFVPKIEMNLIYYEVLKLNEKLVN